MRMTRLEWQYLQKIALDHPYFDTHKLPLTEKEAKTIVEANNTMTGREFVDSIYAKLGMTRPAEEKKHFAWLHSLSELITVPPIRKIAIAVLVVILMTVFFAATPTGRAIAESVIRYIATLLEDGGVYVNRSDNETIMHDLNKTPVLANPKDTSPVSENTIPEYEENDEVNVDTFEEFIAATGVLPTVLPFPYTKLCYINDEFQHYLRLHAVYETPKGMIVTVQYWNMPDLTFSTAAGYTVYDTDPSVYYSFDYDGTLNIMKTYEDSAIGIIAEDYYTVDELVNLLNAE